MSGAPGEAPQNDGAQNDGFPNDGAQNENPQGGASDRLDESASEVRALRANLESGELRLDPSAGDDLTAALLEQRDRVDGWLKRVEALAGPAPLGSNPVGEAMAAKFAKRASGDDASFAEVLRRYRHVLDEARDAVNDAMRRYRDLEDGAADEFRKLVR